MRVRERARAKAAGSSLEEAGVDTSFWMAQATRGSSVVQCGLGVIRGAMLRSPSSMHDRWGLGAEPWVDLISH